MIALEFRVIEEEERSPIPAALASGLLCFFAGFPHLYFRSFTRTSPQLKD
jgi:hypothetical protein